MKYRVGEAAPSGFLASLGSVHPVVAAILWQRGIRTEEEAKDFMYPDWERHTHDPFLFSHMEKAVARVNRALANGEMIVIHGDYDADGVTGSCVMYETLTAIAKASGNTANIDVYIPHRENEGYGLRMGTVETLKERGAALIITVDCGIASVAETDYAHSLGIDVIVVDHHAMPPKLSETAIIIHPHVPGERYPFKPLAAVGVAYKFACALILDARKRGLQVPVGFEKWLLDFVSIATVTDVVPLVGENRVLEKFGLTVLAKTRRLGFRSLFRVAGVDPLAIDTQTVGFALGPRINAAGRMRHAKLAFDALTATDPMEADLLASALQEANTERQQETEKMVKLALEKAKSHVNEKVLCLVEDHWPHGLVGLVASRLVNEFRLPAYVVGRTERGLVGSGRSVPGFHITDALRPFSEHLARFGGHPQACGFSVKDEAALEALFAGLRSYAKEHLVNHSTEPSWSVDAELAVHDCTLTLAEQLRLLEPYGEGNPRPTLLVRQAKVIAFNVIGKESTHLRISAEAGQGRLSLIAFKMAGRASELRLGAKVDVIGEVSVNEWNGRRDPQVIVKDFQVIG